MRTRSASARSVEQARVVSLSAAGHPGREIAERVGCSEPTVVKWRQAFAEGGLVGLEDAPRPGQPREIDAEARFATWLGSQQTPPQRLGITLWDALRRARYRRPGP